MARIFHAQQRKALDEGIKIMGDKWEVDIEFVTLGIEMLLEAEGDSSISRNAG